MRNEKQKKPYTTHELFHEIDSLLKGKELLPDFLDYGIASGREDTEIRTHFWDVVFTVRFGGSEGIYLNLFLDGELDSSGKSAACRLRRLGKGDGLRGIRQRLRAG